jgi:hypothetical protein
VCAVRLHEAGHDVSLLARGERLTALRRHGVELAEENSTAVRQVPVRIVEHPAGGYDLTAVFVRAHHVESGDPANLRPSLVRARWRGAVLKLFGTSRFPKFPILSPHHLHVLGILTGAGVSVRGAALAALTKGVPWPSRRGLSVVGRAPQRA